LTFWGIPALIEIPALADVSRARTGTSDADTLPDCALCGINIPAVTSQLFPESAVRYFRSGRVNY
jgi:hypothetical protein